MLRCRGSVANQYRGDCLPNCSNLVAGLGVGFQHDVKRGQAVRPLGIDLGPLCEEQFRNRLVAGLDGTMQRRLSQRIGFVRLVQSRPARNVFAHRPDVTGPGRIPNRNRRRSGQFGRFSGRVRLDDFSHRFDDGRARRPTAPARFPGRNRPRRKQLSGLIIFS